MTGLELRWLRVGVGLTQRKAALRSGYSQGAISLMETGKREIPADYVAYLRLEEKLANDQARIRVGGASVEMFHVKQSLGVTWTEVVRAGLAALLERRGGKR